MTTLFDVAAWPAREVVKKIRKGISAESFVQMADRLGLSQEELAGKLGLAARTLHRKRKAKEALSPHESEKIIRLARIWNSARALFTTDSAIAQWLMTPAASLGSVCPLDLMDTDVGAADVEGLIKGLAYGNYQ